jgi:hypothetical protein
MVVVISLDGFPAYALDDPTLPIPTLRQLIRAGVSARMAAVKMIEKEKMVHVPTVYDAAFKAGLTTARWHEIPKSLVAYVQRVRISSFWFSPSAVTPGLLELS